MLSSVEEPLKEPDRAYLAGLIDTKGTIYCYEEELRGLPQIRLYLKIYGLDEAVFQWLTELLVSFGIVPIAGTSVVTLRDLQATRILASCFYFLKSSRERARVALELGKTRPGRGCRSVGHVIEQRRLASKLSDLNHGRG